MKQLIIILLCLWGFTSYSQTIGYLRYDTVKIYTTKVGGRGSLDITGNIKATGLLPKSAATDSVIVRDASGNFGTTAKSAFGGGAVPISSLTAATGTNSIDNLGFAQTWAWNSLTSGSALLLSSNSGSSSSAKYMLEIASSGANTGSNRKSYGLVSEIQNTGTGSSNVAGLFAASGGSTNYALITAGGNVGINVLSPTQILHVGGFTQIGTIGSILGQIGIAGSASGNVTIQPAAAAGTWTMTLPTTDGAANEFLQTDGNGVTTWAAGGGSAALTSTQVGYGDGSNVLTGEAAFTYNAGTNKLTVTGDISVNGQVLGKATGDAISQAWGVGALNSITSGSGNHAIGTQALAATTTGNSNYAFGYQALLSNQGGSGNVAIGESSLRSNISGGSNMAIGLSALYNNTGSDNVAIGAQALILNSSGAQNTGIGSYTLFKNVTASYSTAIGSEALENSTGGSNTAIGYKAAFGVTSGTFNTIIGGWVDAPVLTGTGQLNIGNVLYGTGLYSVAAVSSTPVAGGNIGIGLTTPTARLHIAAGTASASTAPLKLTAGTINTTAEAGAMEYNGTHYLTKSSGLRYATEGTIADFYSDVNNGTTVETDIYTYTTPASTLANDGEKIFFTYTLNLSDITSTATVKVYFAGTVIANTGALTVSATGALIINGWVVRTGATTARASVNINSPTASTAVYTAQTDLTGLTLSGTNIVKVTAQAGGASGGSNDITGKSGTVSWRGVAAN